MRTLSALSSLFLALAAVWLAVMENVLKHEGYAGRTAMALAFAAQAGCTLLFLRFGSRRWVPPMMLGAIGIAVAGASALWRMLTGLDFEGFALVIGVALVIQGVVTGVMLVRNLAAQPV